MSRKIIGFAGPAGCGKTLSARILYEYAYFNGNRATVASFASPLKKCLKDLFKFENKQLTTLEGKEAVDDRYGVSPRVIMQKFGTDFVRETVPDLWCILMRDTIEGVYANYNVFIDDIRFEDEAQLIRDLGGTVVHIIGRSAEIKTSGHKSETGIEKKLLVDRVVHNGGTEKQLRENLMILDLL